MSVKGTVLMMLVAGTDTQVNISRDKGAATPEPRPVQIGGASSSSGPAQRQPRTIEVDPRAPYRKFPNEQRVRFEENPGRPGGPRWIRFENAKLLVLLREQGVWEPLAKI